MGDIDRIIATARKDSRCVSGAETRALCNEIERLQAELAGITEEHARVWEVIRKQEKTIERLRAIVAADDEYFALQARAALLMVRGPLADSFRDEQDAVWKACCETRKAAEAAGGEG